MAGDWSDDCTPHDLGLRRLPVPPEVISLAVRWYLRYGLSYRDVEELPPSAASPLTTKIKPATFGSLVAHW